MARLETPTDTSSSVAHLGNLATALNASSTEYDDPWVIDSGTTDHMTGKSSSFSSYNLCSSKDKIRVANGSLSPICGKGSIVVTPSMPLSSVLHVPNLAANLLSIARITLELNCRAIFYSSYCCFQDLTTARMIGSGSLKDGLYYLDKQPKAQGWLKKAYQITQ